MIHAESVTVENTSNDKVLKNPNSTLRNSDSKNLSIVCKIPKSTKIIPQKIRKQQFTCYKIK